ncbi:MAG: TetR family transcriptional regulator [Cellulomonas sp. 73-92]|uniref:TetR/AcrR family transcriptional regulator n=1 Tax=Cellulomonas sp. 73-92 TaxID=1895740 RepID=UPI000926159F|nr:TetR/AcrR family transcriptional regulator [Cellulomonas sp. 73-92]OJV82190.1 MAG: TetR family transcriptional regulator [Cellulomonas sp. 73-92]
MSGVKTGSASERLLDAAGELFYAEGVHSVGIDRVIERAGVAKASLYNTFGSKESLVAAYLHQRHERTRVRVEAALAGATTPRERILAVFEAQARQMAEPGYRGCAFVAASVEAPSGGAVGLASHEYRAWLRGLFAGPARELGVAQPDELARRLHLIYDGASIAGWMDSDHDAAAEARAAAETLIDAAAR